MLLPRFGIFDLEQVVALPPGSSHLEVPAGESTYVWAKTDKAIIHTCKRNRLHTDYCLPRAR